MWQLNPVPDVTMMKSRKWTFTFPGNIIKQGLWNTPKQIANEFTYVINVTYRVQYPHNDVHLLYNSVKVSIDLQLLVYIQYVILC